MADLEFFDDPSAFLDVAGDYLAAEPVLNTVVATVTRRAADGEPYSGDPRWWVAARDEGRIVGIGMRTAPATPRPLFLLPMPEEAALALARTLHARGEPVAAVNGALPTVQVVADEVARLDRRSAEVHEHTRLHVLDELVEPVAVPGHLRVAEPSDVGLALEWFAAFERDAAEQAGRLGTHGPLEPQDAVTMMNRIEQGRLWFWEDADGERVHLTGANPPAFGVARIGPVYTRRERRGSGFASAAVGAVSRLLLDRDVRVCLFTDQANPTSNKIYEALGYRPVVDMANLLIR